MDIDPKYRLDTGQGQIHLYNHIEYKRWSFNREFMEIMNSDNPLTPKEIRRMIDKNPEFYSHLEAWAERKD